MMQLVERAAGHANLVSRSRPARGPAPYLAMLVVPLGAYQLWTLSGWIADGPAQITDYRDTGSISWQAARIIEVAIVASVLLLVIWVVRGCLRRRALTLDAMLIVGMTVAAFWDPIYNWLTPAWLYSSNWINVNDWFGHAPLMANPNGGRMPYPIVPVLVGYPFWGLGFAILVNACMRRVQQVRPRISPVGLIAIGFVVSGAITVIAFELFELLDLMTAPGYRVPFLGNSLALVFFYSGGLVFGAIACLRFFTGEDGLALPERGAESLGSVRRAMVRLLATTAAVQIIVILGWGVMTMPLSLYSSSYPRMPGHLVNGLCDAPGWTGTTYGPCPGSEGFRLPLRGGK